MTDGLAISIPNFTTERYKLGRYIGRALVRLRAQEALNSLIVVVTISTWLLVLFIFMDRLFSLQKLGVNIWIPWAGITALGVPYILWRTYSPRIHESLAAILADDRLGLNARLCTALTLDPFDASSISFSEAFYDEALRKLSALNVEQAFPVKASRSTALLLIPFLLGAGLYNFMDYQDVFGLVATRENRRKADERRSQTAQTLEKRLSQLVDLSIEDESKEQTGQYKIKQLVQKAEAIAKELQDGSRSENEAMVALGQLKREIQDEKEKLQKGKEFQERLEKLSAKDLNLEDSDLTKHVSEALKMGDAGLAARELRKLSQKIRNDILDDPNKSDEQKKEALNNLKREIEKLAGALAEDEALKDGLQELSEKMMASSEFQSLQDEIKKQLNKQGKGNAKLGDDISRQMEDVAEELERLEEENDANLTEEEEAEMEKLDEVEESLDEAMEGLSEDGEAGECEGGKCEGGKKLKKGGAGKKGKSMKGKSGAKKSGAKQGGKDGNSQQGDPGNQGNKNGRPGNGLGGGPGQGRRPYRDGDAEFKSEKVKGKLQAGAITGLSHFRGQGAKGDAPIEFVHALSTAEQEASSSLELERIPADARDSVKDYFLNVRVGAGLPTEQGPENKGPKSK